MSINFRTNKSVSGRRRLLEKELTIDLPNIGSSAIDDTIARTRNCENMVGWTQIPLGVAGPLTITSMNDERLTMNYYLPLATTEGALVASVNRGCKAITQSGGTTVDSERVGATRAPVFDVKNVTGKKKLEEYVRRNMKALQKCAQETSGHCSLRGITLHNVGPYEYLRLSFDTQDAMGMNMATIAATSIYRYIEAQTGFRCISVSGNVCADKKPSAINTILGRGFRVWADVVIPKKVLMATLKTTAQNLYEVWMSKCMTGSVVAGSMGHNAQTANIVAALFIATGQDPAHVTGASCGTTIARVEDNEDLYLSILLSDLMVGTVGGGTGLATQKEALSILGISGGNNGKNSKLFAEIVGAVVLAGELSLLSSLAEGSLAKAHVALSRGKLQSTKF
jgi:hydroxymethylglutaryl-CoA reductase (NADPH)